MGKFTPEGYAKHRGRMAEQSRQRSRSGRDIGAIPKVADPARRKRCSKSLRLYCETYYPEIFSLAWSEDHLAAIAKIEECILNGGLFAMAFPRGSGKTSLLTIAAEWAVLNGHRCFIVLIGATEDAAGDLLKSMLANLENNDLLLEDYPEACFPIRQLEGETKRAKGQMVQGVRTQITITAKELVLPTVKGSPSSGSRVKVAGITGRIRGMKATRAKDVPEPKGRNPKGGKTRTRSTPPKTTVETIRPDIVLLDDPQTEESAASPKQNKTRMGTINGAVLGLAGPKKKIAAFAAVTVIEKGDVADQMLDRKANPRWQGVRIRLMKSMPTDGKLWEQYSAIWAEGLRSERGIEDATAFYLANREAMDKGAAASWEARFEPGEASAIQYAMNLKFSDEASFLAEYQNEPLSAESEKAVELTPQHFAAKVVNIPRGVVPAQSTKLTGFIDVQGDILFYLILATDPAFGLHIVEYGTYPEQPRLSFTLREVDPTLAKIFPSMDGDGRIRAALDALSDSLLARSWPRDVGDAPPMTISRLMEDSGWKTEVVKKHCRESKHRAILLPSKGFGFDPARTALNDWTDKPGDRKGWNWRWQAALGLMQIDTNPWKAFVAERVLMPLGQKGTLTIHEGEAHRHRMLGEHGASEYGVDVEVKTNGRKARVFIKRPNRENHLWDSLVNAAAAASEQGIVAEGHATAANAPRRIRRLKVIE